MKLKIFFSWEMETNSQGFDNKSFLIECINKAIKLLEQEREFKKVMFEFQEGLSGVSGTPRVAEMMMKRSRECDIFIGDMTIVQRLGKLTQKEIEEKKTFARYSPNANVMMEYAIALNKSITFWEQVILVMNKVNGDVHDDVELFPFDVREERYPVIFMMDGGEGGETVEDVSKRLVGPIREAARSAIRNHKSKFNPLKGWKEQEDGACYPGKYEWTDSLKKIRDTLLSDIDNIRLVGLSGYGKTRLVLESYRGDKNQDHYLYCDMQELGANKVYEMALRVYKEYPEAVFVVDNCGEEGYRMLLDLRKSNHVHTKLITIHNNPNVGIGTAHNCVIMSEKQNEVVDCIFRRYRDYKDQTEHYTFQELTDGNPLIAEHLMAGLKDGEELGGLKDASFIDKLLGNKDGSDEREVLRALSLFAELEYDEVSEKHEELEYIALNKNILSIGKPDGMLVNWLTGIVRDQIRRGNIEKKGTSIRIRPQALSLGLFNEWLDHCDFGRIISVIKDIDKSPLRDSLSDAFKEQINSFM